MLVPRELGHPKTFSTKIWFLKSISEICTLTTLIYSTIPISVIPKTEPYFHVLSDNMEWYLNLVSCLKTLKLESIKRITKRSVIFRNLHKWNPLWIINALALLIETRQSFESIFLLFKPNDISIDEGIRNRLVLSWLLSKRNIFSVANLLKACWTLHTCQLGYCQSRYWWIDWKN